MIIIILGRARSWHPRGGSFNRGFADPRALFDDELYMPIHFNTPLVTDYHTVNFILRLTTIASDNNRLPWL